MAGAFGMLILDMKGAVFESWPLNYSVLLFSCYCITNLITEMHMFIQVYGLPKSKLSGWKYTCAFQPKPW